MKNIVSNKRFIIRIFVLEAILLILGICGGLYNDVVLLILTLFILFIFDLLFLILLGIFNSDKIDFFVKLQGLLVIILFVVSPILAYFNGGFDDYEDSEAEIQKMANEYELQMKRDSIRAENDSL